MADTDPGPRPASMHTGGNVFVSRIQVRDDELAGRLKVSRNPVREALRALETAGWVTVHHRRGAYVSVPAADDGNQLFEVRCMLESQAAGLAAERMVPGTIAQLRDLLEEGAAAAAAADRDRVIALNTAFHRLVFASAGNAVLSELLQVLEKRVTWHFSTIATARGVHSWEEHALLLDALAAGDATRAAAEMTSHIEASRALYREQMTAEQPDVQTG